VIVPATIVQYRHPPGLSIRSAERCMSGSSQLLDEKSLVPKCSGNTGNTPDLSKGVFQNDISGFESYMPSHAVQSLWAI
jgi:hypothetical protein